MLVAIVLACGLLALGTAWVLRNPVSSPPRPVPAPAADAGRLRADVEALAAIAPARSGAFPAAMDEAARHIARSFAAAGCTPEDQPFRVGAAEYRNVICSFGPREAPRLVIGAHYDVDGFDNPGADDNASGVAALLELARMLGAARPALPHRLDLAAYALEEAPYHRTADMGSQVHARSLAEAGTAVKLMISLEMIGYYSDGEGSQSYPFGALRLIYPGRADFIGVVGRMFDRRAVARVKDLMRVSEALPVWSINAPRALPGVDFSDHWSFWRQGMKAVMVTDTAFYRNPHYHRPSDRPETLDYRRLALVVDGLYQVALRY